MTGRPRNNPMRPSCTYPGCAHARSTATSLLCNRHRADPEIRKLYTCTEPGCRWMIADLVSKKCRDHGGDVSESERLVAMHELGTTKRIPMGKRLTPEQKARAARAEGPEPVYLPSWAK